MPLSIDESEVTVTAVRAQGAGGQNVNKVSSAIHLRFDIGASSLPDAVKQRMLLLADARITRAGVVVRNGRSAAIKAFQRVIDLPYVVPNLLMRADVPQENFGACS
jgi:ribosome-associated protein